MSDAEVAILNRKMDKVLSILNNDKDNDKPGLVSEVTTLKQFVHQFVANYNINEAVRARDQKWWIIIWSSLSTGMIFLGKFLIGLIIK